MRGSDTDRPGRQTQVFVGALVAGLVYGLVARVLMDYASAFSVMSIGFVFVCPFVIGCIVMMAPAAYVLATLGALASLLPYPKREPPRPGRDGRPPPPRKPYVAILLLPLAVGLVEERFELPRQIREVDSQIRVAADADSVWSEIVADRAEARARR